jgi:hypothetical protein
LSTPIRSQAASSCGWKDQVSKFHTDCLTPRGKQYICATCAHDTEGYFWSKQSTKINICAQVLPRLHQPVVDYSNDVVAASPSPAAVAPLQPFRAPRRCLRLHALYVDLAVRRDYSSPAARALRRPRRALQLLVSGRTRSTSTLPCAASTRLPVARALRRPRRAPRLLVSGRTCSTSTLPCAATTHHPATHALRQPHHAPRVLLRLRRASGCLGTSRGSSLGSSRRSSSTTSPPPHVRVPRHVARLVVDYFIYAVRPVASAHRAAHRATRRRLLCLRRASGCLGTSRDSSPGSSSTTSTTPHVRLLRHVARLVV